MCTNLQLRTQSSQRKRLTHEQEIELVMQVVGGNDSAWEKLQSAFFPSITGFFVGCIRNSEDAEPLANISMWRAYSLVRKNRYDPKYRFYTFLRMVSRGILSEFRKAQSRRQNTETFSDIALRIGSKDEGESNGEILNVILDPTLPPPEDRLDVIRELLELVFACCAKPHHIIAFGFVKLLGWTPRDMIRDLIGLKKVGELGDRFCEDYYMEAEVLSSLEDFKEDVFARFYEKIERSVSQVYREKEYARLDEYMNEIVRNIPYELFFTKQDRSGAISDWCKKVAKRTQNIITKGKLCTEP
jgi:DNA-directed RNA polymerase specialized sigma24 family protein